MEKKVLAALNWKLTPVTAFQLIDELSKNSNPETLKMVESLTPLLLAAMLDVELVVYKPSAILCACIHVLGFSELMECLDRLPQMKVDPILLDIIHLSDYSLLTL